MPVEVQLVVTDRTLLSGDATPARLVGYGTVPAEYARSLVRPRTSPTDDVAADAGKAGEAYPALLEQAKVWLRRIYTHPADGTLVTMESTKRVFDGALRAFLVARDGGICRTPWCGAPIRHMDHVVPHARGGATDADDAQGKCVRCNLVKELLGWRERVVHPPGPDEHRHTVEITTPTGHRYFSRAPVLVPTDPGLSDSVLENECRRRLEAA